MSKWKWFLKWELELQTRWPQRCNNMSSQSVIISHNASHFLCRKWVTKVCLVQYNMARHLVSQDVRDHSQTTCAVLFAWVSMYQFNLLPTWNCPSWLPFYCVFLWHFGSRVYFCDWSHQQGTVVKRNMDIPFISNFHFHPGWTHSKLTVINLNETEIVASYKGSFNWP